MTRGELVRQIQEILLQAGITSAGFEAKELICDSLGVSKAELLASSFLTVSDAKEKQLFDLAKKRSQGYPLQYLLGEWEFYGREFEVGEGVLIPRADTEVICEEVIRYIGNRAVTVLDLCSGSGCIAITIAMECPNCQVYAIEKSQQAFGYLTRNIDLHQASVKALLGDGLSPDSFEHIPQFDVIVSNPPYLTQADMNALQTEVAFEPKMALDGGIDGLYFYRNFTALWKTYLKPSGRLFYELGAGQEKEVSEILSQNGFYSICTTPDLCGIMRVISGSI